MNTVSETTTRVKLSLHFQAKAKIKKEMSDTETKN